MFLLLFKLENVFSVPQLASGRICIGKVLCICAKVTETCQHNNYCFSFGSISSISNMSRFLACRSISMEDKLTTMIVNETEHDLTMKVGNRHCSVPLAVVEKGGQYAIELHMNYWTYQEFSLEINHNDGEENSKVFVTSQDCCDYEPVTVKESDGIFVTDRVRRQEFNGFEQTGRSSSIFLRGSAFSGAVICDNILRGDSKLASAALKLARHVRTKGLHGGSDELLQPVLQLVEFAQSACKSPLLLSIRMCAPSGVHQLEDPHKYAASLMLLARDVDAHPWGAFGFVHPSKYLPFLQQLAGDLIEW